LNAIQRDYSATEAGLADAMHALEADALQLGLGQRTALTLMLMLEELYTNTLKYGQGERKAADLASSLASGERQPGVRVVLQPLPHGEVELRYEDDGVRHDPFAPDEASHADAAIHGEVEDRPVGRLGILLLRRLSRQVAYEYRHGRNVVRLRLGADASPADFQAP
jgi:anti-sigma regulatory factor (Ser/Thr protein kinase)